MRKFLNQVDKNIIIAMLFGIIPMLWFTRGILVAEEYYAVNYGNWAKLVSEPWIMFANYGWSGIWAAMLPQSLFFLFFQNLFHNYHLSLINWNVLLWSLTGTFFYLSVKKLFGDALDKGAILLGALFYVFNPFFLNIHFLLTPPRVLALALPVILFVALKYKNPFWIALSSTLFSTIFVNIPLGVVFLLYITLVSFLVFILRGKPPRYIYSDEVKSALIKCFITLGLYAIFNIWWILPTVLNIYSKVASVQQNTSNFSAISATHLSDSLSIFGSWAFREKYNQQDYYFPYNLEYDSFPLVYLRFLPLLLLLYAIFKIISLKKDSDTVNAKGNSIITIIFVSLYLIFALLAKGTTGIFGDLYRLFIDLVPGFWIFREPYAKFGLLAAFFLAISMVSALDILFKNFSSKKFNPILLTSVCACLIFLGFPFYNINSFASKLKYDPTAEFKEFTAFFKPKEGYYMLLPSKGLHTQFNWPNRHSGNPIVLETGANIIYKPDYFSENSNLNPVLNYLFKTVTQDPATVPEIANRYAIKGILLQKDAIYYDPVLAQSLNNALLTKQIFSNSSVDLYEFNAPYLIELVKKDNIITVSPDLIDKYETLKKIIPSDHYLAITEENASDIVNAEATVKDYFAGEFTFETSAAYATYFSVFNDYKPVVQNNGKQLNLVENGDNIYSAKVDQVGQNVTKVIVNPPVLNAVEGNWISYDFLNNKIIEKINFENIPRFSGFLSKLEVDSIPRHFMLTISKETIKQPYIIGIAYGDPAKGVVIDLGDAKMLDPTTDINLVLNTRLLDYYLDQFPNGSLYVLVQPLSQQFSLQYINSGLGYSSIDIPDLFYSKYLKTEDSNFNAGTRLKGSYYKISNSIHLFKDMEDTQNTALLFKQAYNTKWRLLPLKNGVINCLESSCKTTDKIKLIGHVLLNFNSGVSPDYNVEHYITGWDMEGRDYKSIVLYYQPTIVYYLCLILFFVAAPIAFIYRKKLQ